MDAAAAKWGSRIAVPEGSSGKLKSTCSVIIRIKQVFEHVLTSNYATMPHHYNAPHLGGVRNPRVKLLEMSSRY